MADTGATALRVARLVALMMGLQAVLLAGLALTGAGTTTSPSVLVVSARTDWAGLVANRINAIEGHPVRAYVGGSVQDARDELRRDVVQGYLVVDPNAPTDQLVVSSAQGDPALLQLVVGRAESTAGRDVGISDLSPLAVGDGSGRVGHWFVLAAVLAAIGFAVGTLRVSALEGLRGVRRLLPILALAALGTAAVGVGIVCWVVPAWGEHAVGLWLIGAAVMATVALLVRAGAAVGGLGGAAVAVAVLLLLAVDPTMAGAFGFGRAGALWRPVADYGPVGAGMSTVRELVQLDVRPQPRHLLTLAWWALAAAVVVVLAAANRGDAADSGRHRPQMS